MGQPHAALEIEGAVSAAESAGIEWLARLGRASLALTGTTEFRARGQRGGDSQQGHS